VIYLHPWVPTNSDPAMDAAMKAEYAKITAKTDIKQLKSLADPVAAWAVTALRNASSSSSAMPRLSPQ
jgi:dCMP deaminase